MGQKCKVKNRVWIILIIGIIVIVGTFKLYSPNYIMKLDNCFEKESEVFVKNIFNFDFDHAYVFSEIYLDGNGLKEAYDLDISIEEVKSGPSENIHRIIFVNKNGELVHEFRYDTNVVVFEEEDIVIYPDTVITNTGDEINGSKRLGFENYDYFIVRE